MKINFKEKQIFSQEFIGSLKYFDTGKVTK
jgi:hypothetical protein